MPTKGVYYFISDDNPGFAEIPVLYNGTSFRLEFDISILHADPELLPCSGYLNITQPTMNRMQFLPSLKARNRARTVT